MASFVRFRWFLAKLSGLARSSAVVRRRFYLMIGPGLALVVLAACASPPDDSSAAEEKGEDNQAVAQLEEEVASLEGVVANLTVERDQLAVDLLTSRASAEDYVATVSALEAEAARLEIEKSEAEQEVSDLREKYDPEIRAEAEAGYNEELARACDAAKSDIDAPITALVRWDESWSAIAVKQDLVNDVTDCAAEQRTRTAEQREADRLAACEAVEPGQLEKNPSFYEGTCVLLYANVVQWDANTGPCSFHANISRTRSTRWYDYDVRATFGLYEDELLSAIETDCPEMADMDNGDFLKIWARGLGAYNYDTSIGGSNTVPSFMIEKVELVKKDD